MTEDTSARALNAIDLFSGAGGLSLGVEAAGFTTLAALDSDGPSATTYRANFPRTPFLQRDVQDVTGADLARAAGGLAVGELDLLIGGPPCQGFSIIGQRLVHDARNDLFRHFLRLAGDLRPRAVAIENVPGLATLAQGAYIQGIQAGLEALGYSGTFAELLAAQYGTPQMRWRMVFIAFRADLDIPPGMGFPEPTHGRANIGDLVPNCTISPEDTTGFVTTREAIGDLPAVEPGEEVCRYDGQPDHPYQKEMRTGLREELFNHYAPRLAPQTLERIRYLAPGQDWRDLPLELLPASMQRAKRKDHTRRYRRMTWEGVPRSIITRFRDPKSGEYTHPEQHRTLTIREAARIQGFPDRFAFCGERSAQYDQVGNAVPAQLAKAVAAEVARVLDGTAVYRLRGAFRRRAALRQTSLTAYGL